MGAADDAVAARPPLPTLHGGKNCCSNFQDNPDSFLRCRGSGFALVLWAGARPTSWRFGRIHEEAALGLGLISSQCTPRPSSVVPVHAPARFSAMTNFPAPVLGLCSRVSSPPPHTTALRWWSCSPFHWGFRPGHSGPFGVAVGAPAVVLESALPLAARRWGVPPLLVLRAFQSTFQGPSPRTRATLLLRVEMHLGGGGNLEWPLYMSTILKLLVKVCGLHCTPGANGRPGAGGAAQRSMSAPTRSPGLRLRADLGQEGRTHRARLRCNELQNNREGAAYRS